MSTIRGLIINLNITQSGVNYRFLEHARRASLLAPEAANDRHENMQEGLLILNEMHSR